MSKKKLFNIIQIGNKDDIPSRVFDIFIATTIILNITVMFLLTFDELQPIFSILTAIEIITLLIFCVEYVLRIWTAEYLYPELSRGKAIGRFLISLDGIIDLLTILPFFYLSGFVAFRILRVVRIFHLFRINNQYDSFHVITTVLKEKANQIVSSMVIVITMMMAASLCMYSVEHEAQPEAFSNAFSGIWWAVSCLFTVGYGDVYPITFLGKIIAIITAFLGVCVVAIPTGIISAGFVEQYTRIKNLDTFTRESSLNFVTIRINPAHIWNGLTIKETQLPQGLNLALILRNNDVLVPRGDIVIHDGDTILLAAEAYNDNLDLKMTEKIIGDQHPWANHAVKDLDISRQTTIVSIHRKNKLIIPTGSTIVKPNDKIILYSKHLDEVH